MFSFLFFLGLFACFCIYVSSLSLPWYSRIWRLWAFRERWELDKGCVKRVFLGLNRCKGYRSSWGFLVCGIAHSTRTEILPHSTRTETLPHSTRIYHIWNPIHQHSIHPDISHPESCPPTFHQPGYLTFGILSADIPSTRISHIRNSVRWHSSTRISHIRNPVCRHSIHSDISHPESCPLTFHPPGYLTSGTLLPDGKGGRFNFPG